MPKARVDAFSNELREKSSAATDGDWSAHKEHVIGPDGDAVAKVYGNLALGGTAEDNAILLALLRNQAHHLADFIEALSEKLDDGGHFESCHLVLDRIQHLDYCPVCTGCDCGADSAREVLGVINSKSSPAN